MIVFERALICAAVVLSGSAATAQRVRFENSANALFQGCKAATQNEKLSLLYIQLPSQVIATA